MNEIPLTNEERDRALDAIAARIHKYRLETPAILFLEINRPLAGITGLASHAVTPLFGAFTGLDNAERYADLLSDREALDALVDRLDNARNARLERAEAHKSGPEPGTRNP